MSNESIVSSRVHDLLYLSSKRNCPLSTSFLTIDEAEEVERILPNGRGVFFGGYFDAERKILIVTPDGLNLEEYQENKDYAYEFCHCLKIEIKGKSYSSSLSHRDYLGSILGLGIERDYIGDLLVGEGEAYCYCLSSVKETLLSLEKVKNHSVSVKEIPFEEMPLTPKIEIKRGTVASLRLDCILCEVFNLSRSEAKEAIEEGLVKYGNKPLTRSDTILEEGMRVSCRGKGKFAFYGEKGTSKKGKAVIEYGLFC